MQLNILNPILYDVATAFVKCSILALYIAIFPQQIFCYWVCFLFVVNALNAVAIVLVSCLQCRPLEALWNPEAGGTCIDFSNFGLFNTSFKFVMDLTIFVSPLRLVMKLNLSNRKKFLLAVTFALGGGYVGTTYDITSLLLRGQRQRKGQRQRQRQRKPGGHAHCRRGRTPLVSSGGLHHQRHGGHQRGDAHVC
ncbi:hypothetical protein VTO42DRAFT_763 [Malbranchea cinnamomea]